MKIFISILLSTMVLGKHARSKIRKKGSCKPLSSEFKDSFYDYRGPQISLM